MKAIIIILCIACAVTITYFLAQPKDDISERTEEFIKTQNEIRRQDSISIDREMQIRIAEEKAKQR